MKRIALIFIASLFFVACGPKGDDNKDNDEETSSAVYKINHENTTIEWEAYKFTERKGVKGAFGQIKTTPEKEIGSLEEIITGTTFEVDVNSINSGDSTRDPKIIAHFFGSMMNTDKIMGKITSYSQTSDTEADVTVDITMNDKTVSVPSKIQLTDKNIKLTTSLKMGEWDAISSVDSLNTICNDLHKGEDGLSKLWPDVSITVNTTYFEAEAD
jgi:polyisoprenoid-binding protein YceI